MNDPSLGGRPRRSSAQNVATTNGARAGLRVTRTDVGLAIAGVVDVGTRRDLSSALGRIDRRPPADEIVVDLSGLSFVDAGAWA